MYICSDSRSNVEMLFVCNICQHKRTFTHITFQAHWLLTRRFRVMAIMVLINGFLTIPIIFFTWIVFVMIFNSWFVHKLRNRWYWWSLEGDMLWWSLASFKCCKIPSHWHWRVLVCEWTNLWQVILFAISFNNNENEEQPFKTNVNCIAMNLISDQLMDKWKWLEWQIVTNQPSGKQLRAFLCIQANDQLWNTMNFKHLPDGGNNRFGYSLQCTKTHLASFTSVNI